MKRSNKVSMVWMHFSVNGRDKVKFEIDSLDFTYHDSTILMRQHLHRRHPWAESDLDKMGF